MPHDQSAVRFVAEASLWRKIHIGIDEKTLEIRAIEATSGSIVDALLLPDLLNQMSPDEEIESVTADDAYDKRKCYDAIAALYARAVISPRKNAELWKPDTSGARAPNETVRSSKYLGRAIFGMMASQARKKISENPRTKPLRRGPFYWESFSYAEVSSIRK